MRRAILGLSALFLLTALALPAPACVNDREVNRSEREFKSQYLEQPPAATPEPSPPSSQTVPYAFLGAGAVLLLGATVSVLKVGKRSDRA